MLQQRCLDYIPSPMQLLRSISQHRAKIWALIFCIGIFVLVMICRLLPVAESNEVTFMYIYHDVNFLFNPLVSQWLSSGQGNQIVILEPICVQCISGDNDTRACNQCQSLSLYRFGLNVEKDENSSELMDQLATSSTYIGWKIEVKSSSSTVISQSNTKVIISLIEHRGEYFYVHGTQPGYQPEQPGRAFLRLTFIDVHYQNSTNLQIPNPADFYLWQWPRSRFLDCNRTAAEYVRRKYPKIYAVKPTIADIFIDVLAHLRDILLDFRLTVMLDGGTALGWYRECGIIPHTTDMDVAFLASEWKPEIEDRLNHDSVVKLLQILGQPDDSLELSVTKDGIKIDLFGLYEVGNRSYIGGMYIWKKTKVRWWYPPFDGACTADLKGRLFYVRCDILRMLNYVYGPEWYEHQHSDKFSMDSHHNFEVLGKYSNKEWPSVYRTFG